MEKELEKKQLLINCKIVITETSQRVQLSETDNFGMIQDTWVMPQISLFLFKITNTGG